MLFIRHDFDRLENQSSLRRTIPLAERKEFTPCLGRDSRSDI